MADEDMPDVPGLDEYVLVEFAANGQRKPMTRAKYDLMVASGSQGLTLLEDEPVPMSVAPGSEVTEAMRRESERLRDGDPNFVPPAAPADVDSAVEGTHDSDAPEPDATEPTAPTADAGEPAADKTRSGGGRRASTSGEEQS